MIISSQQDCKRLLRLLTILGPIQLQAASEAAPKATEQAPKASTVGSRGRAACLQTPPGAAQRFPRAALCVLPRSPLPACVCVCGWEGLQGGAAVHSPLYFAKWRGFFFVMNYAPKTKSEVEELPQICSPWLTRLLCSLFQELCDLRVCLPLTSLFN